MGALSAGTVVLVPFPFSDLSESKLRPAVVLAEAGRGDLVLCQVTSKPYGDPRAVRIVESDLVEGGLHFESYARPGKLFTAHSHLIVKQIGKLKLDRFEILVDAVTSLIRASS